MNQDAHYKQLLFVDQSLEELVTQYNSESSLFSEPYQLWHEGNLDAAIARLKQISADPITEVRHRLWAWKALRQMGEELPATTANEIRGVVFEIPIETWVDTLAAYSDGSLRYLNGMKGVASLLIWENVDYSYTRPLVMQVIDAAASLVRSTPAVEQHQDTIPTEQPRITVLTYGGLYIVDRDRETFNLTDPVLAVGTQLFMTLMEITQQGK